MKTILSFVFLLLATSSCSSNPAGEAAAGDVSIAQGKSYGMCVGYCWSEVVVSQDSARFTETSRDSVRNPPRRRALAISAAEWQRLESLAQPSKLTQVEGTHGCPDCADGGAEWVELRTNDRTIRAFYEANKDLAPIATLQAELRAIRQRFE
jgi:hypothetical protein